MNNRPPPGAQIINGRFMVPDGAGGWAAWTPPPAPPAAGPAVATAAPSVSGEATIRTAARPGANITFGGPVTLEPPPASGPGVRADAAGDDYIRTDRRPPQYDRPPVPDPAR